MVSTSGHRLIKDEAIETLKNELLFEARVITPNIPEAEVLLRCKIKHSDEMPELARKLSFNRKVSVLLKAGHLTGKELTDIFYNAETDEILTLKSERIETRNTHGTGCTLSSALASFLAHGLSLNDSVRKAKEYINAAIIEGAKYQIGKGHGPVNHFFNL
jgi:hydroxymethylpyrimidine/phosphomethylpyrimidine kinase